MVCGRIFLAPALAKLSGLGETAPQSVEAVLGCDLPKNGPREHYMRAMLRNVDGALVCTPFDSQDSSRMALLAQANALAIRAPDDPPRAAGETISVLPLRTTDT